MSSGGREEISSSSGAASSPSGSSPAVVFSLFPKIQLHELEMGKKIGSGTYGKVNVGKWLGVPVAIKKSIFMAEDLEKELSVLLRLRHPNIVTVYGLCEEAPGEFLLVEELAANSLDGHYNAHYKASGQCLPFEETLRLGSQLADALAFIHCRRVTHNDLKSANILVAGDRSENRRLMVADFGSVARFKKPQTVEGELAAALPMPGTQWGEVASTPEWCAPENMSSRRPSLIYQPPGDVYAAASVIVELLTGCPPYWKRCGNNISVDEDLVPEGLRQNITEELVASVKPKLPEDTPPWLQALIRACWENDPDMRPTAAVLAQCIKARSPPPPAGWGLQRNAALLTAVGVPQAAELATEECGFAGGAKLQRPRAVAVGRDGVLFVASASTLFRVHPHAERAEYAYAAHKVDVFDRTSAVALALSQDGSCLYAAVKGSDAILCFDTSSGKSSPLTASGATAPLSFRGPTALLRSGTELYVADAAGIHKVALAAAAAAAGLPGLVTGAEPAQRSCALAVCPASHTLYFTPRGLHAVYALGKGVGVEPRVLCGSPEEPGAQDGPGSLAKLCMPYGLAMHPNGFIYISTGFFGGEGEPHSCLRCIDPATGYVITVAGEVGASADSLMPENPLLNAPGGLSVAPDGSLLVADRYNNRVAQAMLPPPTGSLYFHGTPLGGREPHSFWAYPEGMQLAMRPLFDTRDSPKAFCGNFAPGTSACAIEGAQHFVCLGHKAALKGLIV